MCKEKIVIVIDMQNDFVTGSLANREAQAIVPHLRAGLEEVTRAGVKVFFTRDTHYENYPETQEGRLLPVVHCIKDTPGWEIVPELSAFVTDSNVLDKLSFGSMELPEWLKKIVGEDFEQVSEIEMWGVCTDICVISNAMILKAAYPEKTISVSGELCAGVTPESHNNALAAMKMCQINIV